jgi:uncharacterized protein YcgI (DUF1989 family)
MGLVGQIRRKEEGKFICVSRLKKSMASRGVVRVDLIQKLNEFKAQLRISMS